VARVMWTINKGITVLVLITVMVAWSSAVAGDQQAPFVRLLTLCPPQKIVWPSPPPTFAPREWNFSQGLPPDWAAGPEGVVVTKASGGITLTSPEGARPWLEIKMTIDPLEYKQLGVVMESSSIQTFFLFHSCKDPTQFPPLNRVFEKCDSLIGEQTLDLALPDPELVENPICALRLYPGDRLGAVTVKKLTLIPRDRGDLSHRLSGESRLELRQGYRDCWRFAGSGEREVSLQLPEEVTTLRFATGTLHGRGPAELQLELQTNTGDTDSIFRQPIRPQNAGWREDQVDLTPWKGKAVTLRFRVTGADPSSIRLIGSPVILKAVVGRRPSVLLIVIDTLRADRLSAYGHPRHTSPHLASFAREGLLFSRAFTPASWTIPAVSSLFTGFYPGHPGSGTGHGVTIPDDIPTIAESFSCNGYATAGFSANFLLNQARGFLRGFDTYYLAPLKEGLPSAASLSAQTLSWLRAHDHEASFCYVHFMDPHAPYRSPWPFPPMEPGAGPFRPAERDGWRDGYPRRLIEDFQILEPPDLSQLNRLFDDGVAYTDFQVGLLLARLRQEGLLDNMVVLITADHGEELQDHGYWGHGTTLYQEAVHIPMILRLPQSGGDTSTVSHDPVSLVDVGPTLTALAGLKISPACTGDGEHLLRIPPDRCLFSRTTAHGPLRISIVDFPYKYVFFNRRSIEDAPPTAQGRWLARHGQPSELLFNLEEDPGEQHNLIGHLPDVESELRRQARNKLVNLGQEVELPTPSEENLDPDMLEQLRALGYIQ